MHIVDRLLNKRPRTAKNISLEIAAQKAEIDASQAVRLAAATARKAAIENFDDEAHRGADEAIAAAGRDVERREHAVEVLSIAHAERVDIEAREAFRREVEAAASSMKVIEDRFEKRYPAIAAEIATFARELVAANYTKDRLVREARALGEAPPKYESRYGTVALVIGDLPSIDKPGFIHQALGRILA